jgi:hypothetical protein
MAAEPLSTTRRALLGAAASLPILSLAPAHAVEGAPAIARGARQRTNDPAAWTRRLSRYRRLAVRLKAEAETGFLWEANRRYDRDRAVINARFGSWEAALETAEGRKLGRAAFDRVNRAEEAYYDRCTAPALRAAALLSLTPAPDLPALLTKIQVMQAHELQEEDALPKPALEVLAEDVEVLLSSPA